MAAGMGSRYGGVKQIDSVGMHGETLLDFGVYDAFHNGYGKVVFIIRRDIEHDFRERLFDRIARPVYPLTGRSPGERFRRSSLRRMR